MEVEPTKQDLMLYKAEFKNQTERYKLMADIKEITEREYNCVYEFYRKTKSCLSSRKKYERRRIHEHECQEIEDVVEKVARRNSTPVKHYRLSPPFNPDGARPLRAIAKAGERKPSIDFKIEIEERPVPQPVTSGRDGSIPRGSRRRRGFVTPENIPGLGTVTEVRRVVVDRQQVKVELLFQGNNKVMKFEHFDVWLVEGVHTPLYEYFLAYTPEALGKLREKAYDFIQQATIKPEGYSARSTATRERYINN